MFFADYRNLSNDSAIDQSEAIAATVSMETVASDDHDASSVELSTMDRYVTPIWYVIGVPGNVIAYVVWIQTRMRHSSGCYLAALAFDEGIFLLLQMFFELQTKWRVRLLEQPVLCEVFPVFFLTSQYLSPLLVLGFTVERYISICHPFQRERFCTTRRAVWTIASLAISSLLLNSVQAYFWVYQPPSAFAKDGTGGVCTVRDEVTANGMGSVWSVWSWVTEMLVFGLVPLAILLLNGLVIRETRRMAEHGRELQRSIKRPTSHNSVKRSTPSATTIMLLAVSFYLIITTLPVTICYVLYLGFPEGDPEMTAEQRATDPTWKRFYVYNGVRMTVEELGMSHYACNFYIYLATGRIFRRELVRVMSRVFCRHLGNGRRNSTERRPLPNNRAYTLEDRRRMKDGSRRSKVLGSTTVTIHDASLSKTDTPTVILKLAQNE